MYIYISKLQSRYTKEFACERVTVHAHVEGVACTSNCMVSENTLSGDETAVEGALVDTTCPRPCLHFGYTVTAHISGSA